MCLDLSRQLYSHKNPLGSIMACGLKHQWYAITMTCVTKRVSMCERTKAHKCERICECNCEHVFDVLSTTGGEMMQAECDNGFEDQHGGRSW